MSAFSNGFGEIIAAHSRAQAIADGVLHDYSDLAAQAGFLHPVAIAEHAWRDAVAWPADESGQDETGRAWDVLTVAYAAIRASAARGQDHGAVAFTVARITTPGQAPEPVELFIDSGPGDHREPVLTATTTRASATDRMPPTGRR